MFDLISTDEEVWIPLGHKEDNSSPCLTLNLSPGNMPTLERINRFQTHGSAVAILLAQTGHVPRWLLPLVILFAAEPKATFLHNDPFLVNTVPQWKYGASAPSLFLPFSEKVSEEVTDPKFNEAAHLYTRTVLKEMELSVSTFASYLYALLLKYILRYPPLIEWTMRHGSRSISSLFAMGSYLFQHTPTTEIIH
jgi:hypothetical protein